MRIKRTWYSTKTWKRNYWTTLTFNIKMDEVLAQQEKKNMSVTYIDYAVIKPGVADHTPLDDILTRLEK